jgi:hypothetical protein
MLARHMYLKEKSAFVRKMPDNGIFPTPLVCFLPRLKFLTSLLRPTGPP